MPRLYARTQRFANRFARPSCADRRRAPPADRAWPAAHVFGRSPQRGVQAARSARRRPGRQVEIGDEKDAAEADGFGVAST